MDTLDLRGLLCPLTWARTKYALSKLAPGGELKVVVDHRPAVPDIKRNSEELGHEVLATSEIEEGVCAAPPEAAFGTERSAPLEQLQRELIVSFLQLDLG